MMAEEDKKELASVRSAAKSAKRQAMPVRVHQLPERAKEKADAAKAAADKNKKARKRKSGSTGFEKDLADTRSSYVGENGKIWEDGEARVLHMDWYSCMHVFIMCLHAFYCA